MTSQVVCDDNLVFIDVVAGGPGSVHDSRVLRISELWNTFANMFPGDTHLLGDGGYPSENKVDGEKRAKLFRKQ